MPARRSTRPKRPPAKYRPDPNPKYHPGPEANGEYVVSKIIDERGAGPGKQYQVVWEGWEDTDPTWEPAKHLKNAPRKIAEWCAFKAEEEERQTQLAAEAARKNEGTTSTDDDAAGATPDEVAGGSGDDNSLEM